MIKVSILYLLLLEVSGCQINLQAPDSPRTKLEKQMLGKYKKIDTEIILRSSVRGKKNLQGPNVSRYAKLDKEFNKSFIKELLKSGIVSENNKGYLIVNEKKVDLEKNDLRVIYLLVAEENRDRKILAKK